jgi:hypothetical protein
MHRTAQASDSLRTPQQCRSTIGNLNRTITGEAAAELVTETSDGVLRGALDSERRALGSFLTACIHEAENATTPDRLRAPLAAAVDVVDTRLRALGVVR